MKKFLLSWTLMGVVCMAFSQQLTLKDQETGQPLIGATVQSELPKTLAITDGHGQVDLSGFKDSESIVIRMLGYQPTSLSYQALSESGFEVALLLTGVPLQELVISASKVEEIQSDVIQKIQVLRKSELQQMNQTSMADVLSQSGNVMVQKSQQGGGSPIIRGFETNRILLVVDGVRMNNAIYRGGHLQNVITLDNAILDRAEVVFGGGSVMYGSDALGGVLHFYTRNPVLSFTDRVHVQGTAYQRYMSASNGLATHADVSVGTQKWGSLSSFTYSTFDDLRQGSNRNPSYPDFGKRDWFVKRINGSDTMVVNKDKNVQVGSGYTQYDLLQKIRFKPTDYSEHILNLQYSTSSEVPRYDRLTQTSASSAPRFGEWYYGPQKRFFGSYAYTYTKANRFFDQAKITTGYQQIEESRIDRRFMSDLKNHRVEQVDVFTVNADVFKLAGEHELRYGAEFTYNGVGSKAFQENIVSGIRTSLDTRYPDGGSSMTSLAMYFTHTWEINDQWILNEGLRVSYVGLDARFKDQSFFPFPFKSVHQDNLAPSGNVGIAYSPGDSWRFSANVSSAFRAPNVDDLSKVFESVQGRVLVPNPDLKAEYTLNGELGISKTFAKRVNLAVNGYYTWLNNGLTVLPSTFNGQDSIIYDGQLSQVTSTQNTSKAYIYGVEGALTGNLTNYLSIRGSINYTYGRIKTDSIDYPLDHIPPVFGKLYAQVKTGAWKSEFFTQFSGWKRVKNYNLIGEDNFNYATPNGMPSWITLNARTTWQMTENFSAQLACENILDQNYRVFASNISAPGRNWIITLRAVF